MTQPFGPDRKDSFQVAISSLTLGSLYEAILEFSGHERMDTFWPAVCRNTRWLFPSRRMCVLQNSDDDGYSVVGVFEQGRFEAGAPDERFHPTTEKVASAVASPNAQWFQNPVGELAATPDPLCKRMVKGDPQWLFVQPVRSKDRNIGVLMFVTGPVDETDRTMLNTLGTIYALHVGMAFELIRATEERRRLQERMVLQERMASLGNLVAGVAHEVNTPIGAIIGAADVSHRCANTLHNELESAIARGALDNNSRLAKACELLLENSAVILEAGRRISDMIKTLKNFARLDEAEFQRCDLHDGIESTLRLVRQEFSDKVTVVREFGAIPLIECYPSQMNQLFMNLFVNAAQAILERGTITVTTGVDGESVRVVVDDTGKGIPAADLGKIFEPGFTTKGGLGVGTGLGLSLCYRIVERHHGSISVTSEVDRGTQFTVKLPLTQPR